MPKTVLITAGPTREKIDPVRFISNRSTGILGYELAKEAKRRGFQVILILGPTKLPKIKGIKTVFIESAKELDKEIRKYLPRSKFLFMTSAVCDFHLRKTFSGKLKRQTHLSLKLDKNPDILKGLSVKRIKKDKVFIGFCLETSKLFQNALRKLKDKNLDYIVATQKSSSKDPFGENKFLPLVIQKEGRKKQFPKIGKKDFAKKLFEMVLS